MTAAPRLLSAVEDLLQQVDASMRAGETRAALVMSSRVSPLIERITAQPEDFRTAAAQERLRQIQARYAAIDGWIAARREEIWAQLQASGVAARRVAAIGPVYGRGRRAIPALNAIG